ncbi:MAG: TolC family protein [Pseudomonadota bacterium]
MNFLLSRFTTYKKRCAVTACFFLFGVGGCTTFSQDRGFDAVKSLTKDRLHQDVAWSRSDADTDTVRHTVQQRLTQPLTADDAVQIALLNNRGLQATYSELGIAEADLVQASWMRNPGFSFMRERAGDEKRIERTFTVDFISLLMAPLATKIEGRRFEQTKLMVANEALRVAAETKKTYYKAVAAAQTVQYMTQVKTAADAGAELAHRMVRAGNWSKLDQAREQMFYADAVAQLARAKQMAVTEREKLIRLMGLSGDDIQFQLFDRLPDLPTASLALTDLEVIAIHQRLDIQAAKLETEGLATSLGLTKTTRFVNVLEASYLRNSETGKPSETGYEISLEIPLFDWGGARIAKAESMYMQAVNRVAEIAVNARSEVRETHAGYLTAYELARHYRDEIVPLRKKISDEFLTRYNGMLTSVFELLADSREQVVAVNASIEAQRDFWLAEVDLQTALGGKLPATSPINSSAVKQGLQQ